MSILPSDYYVACVQLGVREPCPGGNMEHRGCVGDRRGSDIDLSAADFLMTVSIVTVPHFLLHQPLPESLGRQR